MPAFSAILIGHESLAIQCGQMLLDGGHGVRAVVSRNADVLTWARQRGLMTVAPGKALGERLAGLTFDWLFSVANLDIIPADVLGMARKGAVNFHDGPLPRYAGLNAPVWAILNGEARHGITWHLIEGGVDEGDILEQRLFDVVPGETALTLNTKCYAAGIDSFPALIGQLESGALRRQKQDLTRRSYFARNKRPDDGGVIDFSHPAEVIAARVHALDHGQYANPLTCAKLFLGNGFLVVGRAEVVAGQGVPGEVLAADAGGLTVAAASGALRLGGLRNRWGMQTLADVAVGDVLQRLEDADAPHAATLATLRDEQHWKARLETLLPVSLPSLGGKLGKGALREVIALPPGVTQAAAFAACAALILRMSDVEEGDFWLVQNPTTPVWQSDRVPVRFAAQVNLQAAMAAFVADCDSARSRAPMAADLPARLVKVLPPLPAVAFSPDHDGLLTGTALTLCASGDAVTLHGCPAQLSPMAFTLIAERLAHVFDRLTDLSETTALADLACCRFRGHEDKIVTKETEIGHGETEVHEGVQV
jgi:methionyl-tRNA formyltransferase